MKYTKEYCANNEVAIKCDTPENKLKAVMMLISTGKTFGGYILEKDIKRTAHLMSMTENSISTMGGSCIYHSSDYFSGHNYITITCEQFFQDNLNQNYEIY